MGQSDQGFRRYRGLARLTGIRAVAVFEALKGILILATAGALFKWLHSGTQDLADEVARHFYLNPASRYPRIIIDALAHPANFDLKLLGLGAVLYSLIRFAEAYGLWHGKNWAWAFGMASAALYVPFELIGLARRASPVGFAVLGVNLLILVVLWLGRKAAPPAQSG
jgi:uncharacterized membrane protein (DUF2068 family)